MHYTGSSAKALLFLVLSWLVFAGCNLKSLDDPIVIADVENEFYIDFWEDLSPASRNFRMLFQTIEEYDCLNYEIDYQYTKNGPNLIISLREIMAPEDCDPGSAPATAAINIGDFPSGLYNLSIDLQQIVFNLGKLSITEDSYFINMETQKGIIVLRRELLRVPDNTIWGYITYASDQEEPIADNFLSDLMDHSSERSYKNGYYGYFVIDNSGKINVLNRPVNPNLKSFIFQFESEKPDLLDLLSHYRENYGDLVQIKLFNSEGEVL